MRLLIIRLPAYLFGTSRVRGRLEGRLAAVEGLSMQNLASELRRILLPRTRVNKGAPGLSAPLSVAVSSKSRKVRVGLEQPPVVLLGGLHDTLRGSPSC